jgi:hypothetical protein
MIKIKKYIVCDNCGWETEIDSSKLQSESIKDIHYIEYGNFQFCCTDCKNTFLEKTNSK